MFKIGDFSKIAQVSIRSLRHYDKIDLFKPSETDPQTGYRYYSIDQLPQLNRIVALKSLGLTLEQVARLLGENLSIEEMREMLTKKMGEIRAAIEEEQVRLAQLEQRLAYLEQEGAMPEHDIITKSIKPQQIMSLRQYIISPDSIMPLLYTMLQLIHEHGIQLAGEPSLVIYHDVEIPGISAGIELAVPVVNSPVESISLPNERKLHLRELPAVKIMACTLHRGGYGAHLSAHIAVAHWLAHNGYQLNGPAREVIHRHFGTDDSTDNMIEIQFPVVRVTK